jgi:hypothetical protein
MRIARGYLRYFISIAMAMATTAGAFAQAGSEKEPVVIDSPGIDPVPHDGGLSPAIGTCNFQTMRTNKTHPETADGFGWTYNHAPMLAYWNNTFYQEYLSNPKDEHIAPGQTLLVTSQDGRAWSKPQLLFPPYVPPPNTPMPAGYNGYMMHQRMGFYVAPDGRLLSLAFYGHAEDPFEEGGIGRVVREIHKDGTFGPIYFIRYSSHTSWNESNTSYPFYKKSPDAGFVAACDALLGNKLMTMQWYDEDQGLDGFYSLKHNGEAFNWYRRPDSTVVGLWKWSLCAISKDGGATWSKPVRAPTIVMDGAKIWGQKMSDGKYALVYNPTRQGEHRYPLAVVTGDDGIHFKDMALVHGEVPPRRYFGRYKDYGPQYTRGIAEGNGTPPNGDFWLTYSVNKEDIWASRVPTPIRTRVEGAVNDSFDNAAGGVPADWNLYCPQWAPVNVAAVPSDADKSLELVDRDPYDYAKAVRVFQESAKAEVSFKLMAKPSAGGMLDIELLSANGKRPVRLRLDVDGRLKAWNGSQVIDLGPFSPDTWHTFALQCKAGKKGSYSLSIDGAEKIKEAAAAERVDTIQRISFRTGPYRDLPTRQTDNEAPHPDLPGADEPVPLAAFYVNDFHAAAM